MLKFAICHRRACMLDVCRNRALLSEIQNNTTVIVAGAAALALFRRLQNPAHLPHKVTGPERLSAY
eukprot:673451-Rhodomonas_salina.3